LTVDEGDAEADTDDKLADEAVVEPAKTPEPGTSPHTHKIVGGHFDLHVLSSKNMV